MFVCGQALLAIEQLTTVPFLVLGNKIDAPGAVSEEGLRQQLGLFQTTGKVSTWECDGWKMTYGVTFFFVARARYHWTTSDLSKSSCARWWCDKDMVMDSVGYLNTFRHHTHTQTQWNDIHSHVYHNSHSSILITTSIKLFLHWPTNGLGMAKKAGRGWSLLLYFMDSPFSNGHFLLYEWNHPLASGIFMSPMITGRLVAYQIIMQPTGFKPRSAL